jgi:GDPmannose 4,6-dehydratase
MKALIFGANGQDGYYLSESCHKRDIDVTGISRNGHWIKGDVASSEFVENIIRSYKPDLIFNLAAISSTSHDIIYENHDIIGKGTINILESCFRFSPDTKIFISGSGLQFVNNGLPLKESDHFDSSSPYCAVRNYSVYIARYYRSLGLKTYVGYLFHHESPLRNPKYISQKIALAAFRISEGSRENIELDDISFMKEWSFAGDIAEGIMTLVGQDRIFEAVIGSGRAYPIKRWLEECFTLINKNWKDHVIDKRNRTSDNKILVSDPSTINSLGWYATTTIGSLARIMMEHSTQTDKT